RSTTDPTPLAAVHRRPGRSGRILFAPLAHLRTGLSRVEFRFSGKVIFGAETNWPTTPPRGKSVKFGDKAHRLNGGQCGAFGAASGKSLQGVSGAIRTRTKGPPVNVRCCGYSKSRPFADKSRTSRKVS